MSAVETSPNLRDFLRIKDDEACSGTRRRDLAELFLQTTLPTERQPSLLLPPAAPALQSPNRTLLDIIRNEEPNAAPRKSAVPENCNKDRKRWKSLKDKLRLKRTSSGWISPDEAGPSDSSGHKICRSPVMRHDLSRSQSTIPVTTDETTQVMTPSRNSTTAAQSSSYDQVSDGLSPTSRRSTRFGTLVPIKLEPIGSSNSSEQMLSSARQIQLRSESSRSLTLTASSLDRPREFLPDNQSRPAYQADEPARVSIRRLSVVLAEERQLAAREAEAARETSAASATTEEEHPVRMSLMDLLEETEREMELAVTSYDIVGQEEEEEAGGEDVISAVGGGFGGGGVEQSCCICMVRSKGAAFIPCGHTFCRVCSRELWVSRGNCPLCNSCIVEILDIF